MLTNYARLDNITVIGHHLTDVTTALSKSLQHQVDATYISIYHGYSSLLQVCCKCVSVALTHVGYFDRDSCSVTPIELERMLVIVGL